MGLDIIKNIDRYIGSCCGNSFVIFDSRGVLFDRRTKILNSIHCINEYNIDTALFLLKTDKADIRMEIFERDGTESDACGNGAILTAHLLKLLSGTVEMKNVVIATNGDKMKQSIYINFDFSCTEIINESEKILFVKVGGEPHIVYIVKENIDLLNLEVIGKENQIEYPSGVNVNLVQRENDLSFKIRTYERGVYRETKSCGTGSLSSYLAVCYFYDKIYNEPVKFTSSGGIHWVSRDRDMLRLETLREYCKISRI